MSLSSAERQLYSNVGNLGMALQMFLRTMGDQLPSCKSQLDSINDMLNQQYVEAERNCVMDMMVGNGPIATAKRRVNSANAKLEIEIGLPKAYRTAEEQYKINVSSLLTEAARYYLGTRSVTQDEHYYWPIDKLLPKDSPALRGPLGHFKPSLEVNNSGIYQTETGNQWRPVKGWVLAIDVKVNFENHSVILLHDNGTVEVETYVGIEKQWVRHSNTRYINIELWKSELARLMELWGLIPKAMPTEAYVRDTLKDIVAERGIVSGVESNPESSRSHYPNQHADHPTLVSQYTDLLLKAEESTIRRRTFTVSERKGRLTIMWSTDPSVENGPEYNFMFFAHWYGFSTCHAWDALPIPLRQDVLKQMRSGMSILGTDPIPDEADTDTAIPDATGAVGAE